MWAKLDDKFPDHPKLFIAGTLIGGPRARGRALALFVSAVCYSNHYLTDGFIPDAALVKFTIDDEPLRVARILAHRSVRLFERKTKGFLIHDYHDYNPHAEEVREKRDRDRDRKQRERRGAPVRAGAMNAHEAGTGSGARPRGVRADNARTTDRIHSLSAVCPRRSRARDPDLKDQYVLRRSPRLRAGHPTKNTKVLKALIWREVGAVFADPRSTGADLDTTSLAEHCKGMAARAGIDYYGDEFTRDVFCITLDLAIRRWRARVDDRRIA